MVIHELHPTMEEDDQDSLFGSPPPSPRVEGRAASPALALPSAAGTTKSSLSASITSAAASIQNVGTIALPGSQPDSTHPLALSLNHGLVPRPPALPQNQSQFTAGVQNDSTGAAGPSRSVGTAPPTSGGTSSSGKVKKRSRPSQSRCQSEPVTEPALEFTLPDPSAPPPVHFLRCQENLLGKAGRIGGITTVTRGSTPSNPILIDDDHDTPVIGRRDRSNSRETSQTPIDPMKLAQPTNEEIVSVLVGQKDIFPVLESILKLIASGVQPKPPPPPRITGFERRPPGSLAHEWGMGPPAKKRKLNRVPAGATDWDVPFPFADGEGPTAYHQNWEQDRGKQLIAELIKLIKVASRKAATKKYMTQQKCETDAEKDDDATKNFKGYYRPETALYGLQNSPTESGVPKGGSFQFGRAVSPVSRQLNQTSSETLVHPISSPSVSSSQTGIQQSLDQLLSCFMESSANRAAPEISQAPASSVPATTDKNAFDAWMNILEAFPLSFDGSGTGTHVSSGETTDITTPSGIDGCGLPSDLDTIFNSLMEIPSSITTPSATRDNPDTQVPFSPPLFDFTSITPNLPDTSVQDLPAFHLFEPILATDVPMDAFFAMPSTADSFGTQTNGVSEDLAQPSSPPPSTSSGSQAVTPASANWDFSFPDTFSGDREEQGDVAMAVDPGRNNFSEKHPDGGFLSKKPTVTDKGKATEVAIPEKGSQLRPVTESPFNAFLSSKIRDELLATIGSASSTTAPAAMKATKRCSEAENERLRRKEEIIRRAKDRRQEIQEGLNHIKTQLWETTVEQAGLIHLTKGLEVEGEISSEGRPS